MRCSESGMSVAVAGVRCKLVSFVAILACSTTCGCKLLPKPSDELRHESYIRTQKLFSGSQELAKKQTYIILSGAARFRAAIDSESKKVEWSGGENGFASGLAVACEADGYMLTTAHALDATNFVLGWFDGKMDVKPARVIFKRHSNTHADLALIKVEAQLEHFGVSGEKPRAGDQVFAVVGFRTRTGVAIGFAAGRVLSVEPDPVGGSLDLIRSDVPLWHGDSGGPLLSCNGRVVGINSGLTFTLRNHWSDSFYPDNRFIKALITKDRSLRSPTASVE
jgi:S1-C subfamily serine protease